ncbi:unnamed protein product [Sphagnum troendelagicum]|uniref:Uncharacterized protein n=1 Tax=Sphagnum troendelagicum TaxID=128251 RepID=A0ABP0U984_9BRYO
MHLLIDKSGHKAGTSMMAWIQMFDIDALIYNAFTVLDMMHDEGRHDLDDNENAGVEPDRENVVGDSLHGQRNLQQNGGNVWTNNVRKAENEDSAYEGEELEEDIEAMPEAPLDPPSGPDQDARDEASRCHCTVERNFWV